MNYNMFNLKNKYIYYFIINLIKLINTLINLK